jgi:hypothetical protein
VSDTFDIDVEGLTLGDLEFIEEYTGQSADNLKEVLSDPKAPKAKLLTALYFVAQRAKDPGFTIEDAKKVKLTLPSS